MINPFRLLKKYIKHLLYIDPHNKYRVVEVMRKRDFVNGLYLSYEVEHKAWYYKIFKSWVVVTHGNWAYHETFDDVASAKQHMRELISKETAEKLNVVPSNLEKKPYRKVIK